MAEAEGYVASISDGQAEVWIQAEDCHAPCDQEGHRCDHCAAATSGVLVKVQNGARARVGDRVVVSLMPRALMVNLLTLVGLPLAGVALGFTAGWLMAAGGNSNGLVLGTLCGLGAGITAAALVYRRVSAENQPFIRTVARPAGPVMSTGKARDPVCNEEVDPDTAASSIGYQGETYYFAHADCLKAFLKEPSKYL